MHRYHNNDLSITTQTDVQNYAKIHYTMLAMHRNQGRGIVCTSTATQDAAELKHKQKTSAKSAASKHFHVKVSGTQSALPSYNCVIHKCPPPLFMVTSRQWACVQNYGQYTTFCP